MRLGVLAHNEPLHVGRPVGERCTRNCVRSERQAADGGSAQLSDVMLDLLREQPVARWLEDHTLCVNEVLGFGATAQRDVFEDQSMLLEFIDQGITQRLRWCGRSRKGCHSSVILGAVQDSAALQGLPGPCRGPPRTSTRTLRLDRKSVV